jgi:hypothetical protein
MSSSLLEKRRRWLQFSLRTLLIAVLILSLPLSWFAGKMQRARRQARTVQAIRREGSVSYEWEAHHRERPWMCRLFGDDLVSPIIVVCLFDSAATDATLAQIEEFTALRELQICNGTVSDDGLKHLGCLASLTHLTIVNSPITNQGMTHLAHLTSLEHVNIHETHVTPEGWEHIRHLPNLTSLFATEGASAEQIRRFESAVPNRNVWEVPANDDRPSFRGVIGQGLGQVVGEGFELSGSLVPAYLPDLPVAESSEKARVGPAWPAAGAPEASGKASLTGSITSAGSTAPPAGPLADSAESERASPNSAKPVLEDAPLWSPPP